MKNQLLLSLCALICFAGCTDSPVEQASNSKASPKPYQRGVEEPAIEKKTLPPQSKDLGSANVSAHLSRESSSPTLIVQFDLDTDWFLFAEAGYDAAPPTIELEFCEGVARKGSWKKPLPTFNLLSPEEKIYKNRVVFEQPLEVKSGVFDDLKVHIWFQICNGKKVEPAKFITREVTIDGTAQSLSKFEP